MILNQRDDRHAQVIDTARRMMTAIRTAPKAKGNDLIETILVEGDDMRRLSDAMLQLFAETSRPVYQRDAANILQGDAVYAPSLWGSTAGTAASRHVPTNPHRLRVRSTP